MRDVAKLLENYKPLILSIYKRFHPMFNVKEDKEDLMAQINSLFAKLVYEYDPRRGVDFPYYIKRMLELRTYHYVTKQLQVKNKEYLTYGFTNDETNFGQSAFDELETLLNVQSWDDDFTLGKKQKRLFISLLVEHKSLREIAEEEGVNISVLHTRLHFLLKKLKQQAEKQKLLEEED